MKPITNRERKLAEQWRNGCTCAQIGKAHNVPPFQASRLISNARRRFPTLFPLRRTQRNTMPIRKMIDILEGCSARNDANVQRVIFDLQTLRQRKAK